MFCADWDPSSNILTFANAGHNLPLVVRSDEEIDILPKTKGIMIGGLPNQLYPEESIHIDDGNIVVFYTDGIVEAANGHGDMYRLDKLQNVLKNNFDQDIKNVETAIVDSIHDFTDGVPQRDDITLVLLKVSNEKTDITSFNAPIFSIE